MGGVVVDLDAAVEKKGEEFRELGWVMSMMDYVCF